MSELWILTEKSGFFGQNLMPWESLDVPYLIKRLSAEFAVRQATYEQIACGDIDLSGKLIIHSSSQQPEYKAYVDDILLYLSAKHNVLVPSIHVTRSHENKGYQELHRRLVGCPALPCQYLAKSSTIDQSKVKLPAVYKDIAGFGSCGVRLVRSPAELSEASKADFCFSRKQIPRILRQTLGRLWRKHVLRRKNLQPYGDYYKPLKRFVIQELVPGLASDYKVLVFGSQVFVLKRNVNQDDFRASGSGNFVFEEPPEALLDFARQCFVRFDEPYMSFDICQSRSDFHLIEFQGVHFGIYTVTGSPFHYKWEAQRWKKVDRPNVIFEEVVADALLEFLAERRR